MSLLLYELKLRELDDSTLNDLSIMSEDYAKLAMYPDSDERFAYRPDKPPLAICFGIFTGKSETSIRIFS